MGTDMLKNVNRKHGARLRPRNSADTLLSALVAIKPKP